MYAHCDVLVVGGGPAGLAAAYAAARDRRAGDPRRVARRSCGRARPASAGRCATRASGSRSRRRRGCCCARPRSAPTTRATSCSPSAARTTSAARRRRASRASGCGTSARGEIVLATGAHERPIAFAGNDLPGRDARRRGARRTSSASASLAGSRAVLLTTNDAGLRGGRGARRRRARGRRGRRPAPGRPGGAGRRRAPGCVGRVRRRGRSPRDRRGRRRPLDRLRPAARLRRLEPGRPPAQPGPGHGALGRGRRRLRARRRAGRLARRGRGHRHVRPRRLPRARAPPPARRPPRRPASARRTAPPRRCPSRRPSPRRCSGRSRRPTGRSEDDCFVDQQRDATVADVRRAAGAGLRSPEHVKRFTTIGTANDQGRTSGVLTLGVMAELLERPIDALGPTTFRPPFTPVSFALLAGRDRGDLSDPVRTTAIHPWHVAHGAVFEDVGQWKRPWFYPRERRGHGRRRAARVRRGARLRGDDGRVDARQDRRPGAGRGDLPQPALHGRLLDAQAGPLPLRPAVHRRRDGVRRRRDDAALPRTASSSPRRPATRRRCSTGSRSGCRPSGPSCASTARR